MRVKLIRRLSPRRWTNVGFSRGGHIDGATHGSSWSLFLPGVIVEFSRAWSIA